MQIIVVADIFIHVTLLLIGFVQLYRHGVDRFKVDFSNGRRGPWCSISFAHDTWWLGTFAEIEFSWFPYFSWPRPSLFSFLGSFPESDTKSYKYLVASFVWTSICRQRIRSCGIRSSTYAKKELNEIYGVIAHIYSSLPINLHTPFY
jgi:hypothetical protein